MVGDHVSSPCFLTWYGDLVRGPGTGTSVFELCFSIIDPESYEISSGLAKSDPPLPCKMGAPRVQNQDLNDPNQDSKPWSKTWAKNILP